MYDFTVSLNWLMSTLSRAITLLSDRNAPFEQKLPTMSVEYESPTSTLLPVAIAFCSFSSSWPECTSTLTLGYFFSKSSTTDWMTLASRSEKKCQNDTVPDRSDGVLSWNDVPEDPPEQPARVSAAAAATAAAAMR